MKDKYLWLIVVFVIGLSLGYAWRLMQDSNGRMNAHLQGQRYLLEVIDAESRKGYDFNINILDKSVSFMPIKGSDRVRVVER